MPSQFERTSTSDQSRIDRASKTARPKRRARRVRRCRRPRLPSPARFLRHIGTGDVELLRPLVPTRTWVELSARQRRRLMSQIEIVSAWQLYSEAAEVRWGNTTRAVERFTEAARLAWGERLTCRTFGRWLGVLASSGLQGLVDKRGRPRGRWRVDLKLWKRLRQLVADGMSVAGAHAKVQPEAARRGLWWPVLRTVQTRMRQERLQLALNKHLLRDCSLN